MAEQREDVTPEECKQRYDEYKADYTQRLTHSFIDVHRKEVRCCYRVHEGHTVVKTIGVRNLFEPTDRLDAAACDLLCSVAGVDSLPDMEYRAYRYERSTAYLMHLWAI